MLVRWLRRVLGLGLLAYLAAGLWSALADDSAPPVTENAVDASPRALANQYRRVPNYFGQLGLSAEQRERIYDLRHPYYTKILELKDEIRKLQASEMADCEAVLAEDQRNTLTRLREEAKARRQGAVRVGTNSSIAARP